MFGRRVVGESGAIARAIGRGRAPAPSPSHTPSSSPFPRAEPPAASGPSERNAADRGATEPGTDVPGARFEARQWPGDDLVIVSHDARFAPFFGAREGMRLPHGTGFARLVHPDDHGALLAECEGSAARGQTDIAHEFRVRVRPGEDDRWVMVALRERPGAGGERRWTGLLLDATARKRDETRIHTLAYFDTLTNLPNRRLFTERLETALGGRPRRRCWGAVGFLDLDNFKVLNDTRGHGAGDVLLAEIARRLRHCAPEGVTVARLGGDEFTVLFEEIDADETRAIERVEGLARLLLRAIDQPVDVGGGTHTVTSSIGLAMFRHGAGGAERVLREADTAMYAAKEGGKNEFRRFTNALREHVDANVDLMGDLRDALRADALDLVYQPKVNREGRIASTEMLLRWQHPALGAVSPARFIPMAERSGLIVEINDWVLRRGAQTLRRWSADAAMEGVGLAINISAHQFEPGRLKERIERELPHRSMRERLTIELTERVMGEDERQVRRAMQELKGLGVKLALDDFGTGYSSFALLKSLPIDELKIDGSFVRELERHEDRMIVRAIISMARSLEITTVAECVETEAQLNVLREEGCHVFQGYFYGPPVTLEVLEQLLRLPSVADDRGTVRAA